MRGVVLAIAFLLATFSLATTAIAAAHHIRSGFEFPRDHKATVLVTYPDVRVNRQVQGQEVPSSEWTELAQKNLLMSLKASRLSSLVNLNFMTSEQAQASPLYAKLMATYYQRTSEIVFQVPQGSPDVTKAKKCRCTYDFFEFKDSILSEFGPAEFVLLINQTDTYATTGQIMGEIADAATVAIGTPKGMMPPLRQTRTHAGNAILFDLKSGEVVWMHGDGAFGGDLREQASASVRVLQVLSGFPGLKN